MKVKEIFPSVVILAVLEDEMKPLIKYFNAELSKDYQLPIWISKDFGNQLIIYKLQKMGNTIAATSVHKVIEAFPSINYIIFSGIAGGNPKLLNYGDIVISDYPGIVQYDFGKKFEDRFEIRANPIPPSSILLGYAQNYLIHFDTNEIDKFNDFILREVNSLNEKINFPEFFPLKAMMGRIGSANMVLANKEDRDKLFNEEKIIAVDMEGAGVADAAWEREKGYLVIRAICDYCDSEKSDKFHDLASYSVAFFTRKFIDFYSSQIFQLSQKAERKIPSKPEIQSDQKIERKIPSTPEIQSDFNKLVSFCQILMTNKYNSKYILETSDFLVGMKYIHVKKKYREPELRIIFPSYNYTIRIQLSVGEYRYSLSKMGENSKNMDISGKTNKFLEHIRENINILYGIELKYPDIYDNIEVELNFEVKTAAAVMSGTFGGQSRSLVSKYLEFNLKVKNNGNLKKIIERIEYIFPHLQKIVHEENIINIEGITQIIIKRKYSKIKKLDPSITEGIPKQFQCSIQLSSGRKILSNVISPPEFKRFISS